MDTAATASTDTVITDAAFSGNASDFDKYFKQVLKSCVAATGASNKLPLGSDYNYHQSFSACRNFNIKIQERVLSKVEALLNYNSSFQKQNKGGVDGVKHETTVRRIDHSLEPEDQFDVVIDALDQYLEQVDKTIDFDILKINKNQNTQSNGGGEVGSFTDDPSSKEYISGTASVGNSNSQYVMLHCNNISRPQQNFKVDNSNAPFIPKLTSKPHALVPLQDSIKEIQYSNSSNSTCTTTTTIDEVITSYYQHPYNYELEEFSKNIPPSQKQSISSPDAYTDIDSTECKFIDTIEELESLVTVLNQSKVFAVDLEHHNYRSFMGFTCLMQISTKEEDYIIDTLACRKHMYLLLDPFANPHIVKVFHGADMDIQWLQKDFGLYIVNLFDTGQASRVLQYPRFSLAYLLDKFCGVKVDKKYQLADWRIRPLPTEMFKYARMDTHYLIYIYEMMLNELIERGNESANLLTSVWDRSVDVCRIRFEKDLLSKNSFMDLYLKFNKGITLNTAQLSVMKALYEWRDEVARTEDESVRYVLPHHMLLKLSKDMPEENVKVFACCTPSPPLVRFQIQELLMLITQAKKKPLDKDYVYNYVSKKQQLRVDGWSGTAGSTNELAVGVIDKSLDIGDGLVTDKSSGVNVDKNMQRTLLKWSKVVLSSGKNNTFDNNTTSTTSKIQSNAIDWGMTDMMSLYTKESVGDCGGKNVNGKQIQDIVFDMRDPSHTYDKVYGDQVHEVDVSNKDGNNNSNVESICTTSVAVQGTDVDSNGRTNPKSIKATTHDSEMREKIRAMTDIELKVESNDNSGNNNSVLGDGDAIIMEEMNSTRSSNKKRKKKQKAMKGKKLKVVGGNNDNNSSTGVVKFDYATAAAATNTALSGNAVGVSSLPKSNTVVKGSGGGKKNRQKFSDFKNISELKMKGEARANLQPASGSKVIDANRNNSSKKSSKIQTSWPSNKT